MNYTERLMNTARQYIASNKQTDWVFAYAGGSVGRGDADIYSNLNLYIVVSSTNFESIVTNVQYDGVFIRLHIRAWEGSCVLRSQPWRNRFLSEARVVYDPYGAFEALKPAVFDYFASIEGRRKMLQQSQEEVQLYLKCLDSCIRTEDPFGASLAAQAAWLTAASSLVWMRHSCCSGSNMFSIMQIEEPETYSEFRRICAQENAVPIDGSLLSLAHYRHFLREQNESISRLEPIMDTQLARRSERMLVTGRNEVHAVQWMLRREAVHCYMATGGTFGRFSKHYHQAPFAIQHHLDQLGFSAYPSRQISELLCQVEWLTEQAKRAAELAVHEIS